MKKDWNIITYEKGEKFWMCEIWEDITVFELHWISIQFNCYRVKDYKMVDIVHIESKTPWSGKFDEVLKEFTKTFKNAKVIQVTNLLNHGLVKYFNKYNILIYE